MLTSGIPQLTTVSDLDYLKYTLALEMTEDEAKRNFRNKLIEALNSMSVKINWLIHNYVHGNWWEREIDYDSFGGYVI